MPRRTVGVEIGADAIRLVRLSGGWRHAHVDGWQQRLLPDTADVDYRSAVVQELRELNAAGWFKGDQVVVSLSADHVTSRVVSVPFQDQSKISQVLAFEVEALIPFELEQVDLSWRSIRMTRSLI